MQERRKDFRLPVSSVAVTILSDEKVCVWATVIDRSEGGLGLRLTAPLIPGTSIKIELGDELLLAEVAHCERHNGSFRAGLTVKHSLASLADLRRMNRALHEASPKPQAPSHTGARAPSIMEG